MEPKKTAHEWSSASLLAKAQRYAGIMLDQDRGDWQFGFWSSLVLEILLRAALGHVSSTLLADGKDWNNILHALGKSSNASKFSPKSADISEVVGRVESLFPAFNREMSNFATLHLQRRNAELHSGATPFDAIGTAQWLPMFYATCKALLSTVDQPLSTVFNFEEAQTAETLIAALADEAAKAVKGTINAHKTIWNEKPDAEQAQLAAQAKLLAARNYGHRASCPACASIGLIQGTPAGPTTVSLKDDVVVEKQSMIPAHFECKACGLKITGYSKLNACGLGGMYTTTSHYDPTEYFSHDEDYVVDDDDHPPYEDDNNEP